MHLIVGLIVAFVIVAIAVRKGKATRNCRWRADHTGDRDGLHKYRCLACGAEAFSDREGPPAHCEMNKPQA